MNRGVHPIGRESHERSGKLVEYCFGSFVNGPHGLIDDFSQRRRYQGASINSQTKERYIPVELWAGTDWDGKTELKMPPVDNIYRHRRAHYEIKGWNGRIR
jgi:hypothetical protein